jgi:hypothetical protein
VTRTRKYGFASDVAFATEQRSRACTDVEMLATGLGSASRSTPL